MGAHQFFVTPGELTTEHAWVRGDDARHAANVLRLKVGERLRVADGRGRVADAVATAVSAREVAATVERVRVEAAPRPALRVIPALLKSSKLDLVVQKLTELGAERILPAVCERSVVRWDARKTAGATTRWSAIAREAAKQSHRARVPAVEPVAPLPAQLGRAGGHLVVFEVGGTHPLRAALPAQPPEALTLVIGPEGGLTSTELATCTAAGATVASLGSTILRAETAMIAATAAVRFHYGLLG